MLSVIDKSLNDVILRRFQKLSGVERIGHFLEFTEGEFSRKDYMGVFKAISTATASRDLQQGVELGAIKKTGIGNKTKYKRTTGHNAK